MTENKKYNWWDDPKNAEEVQRISWWEYTENKTTIELPVSIVENGGYWTITGNKETEKLIGSGLSVCASGESKDEAIRSFFILMKVAHSYEEECRLKYQCWVPFRKGDWGHTGGTWFVVFGIHFYLRYGKGMKGGKYILFTKLNISIHSEWTTYKNFKNKNL